MGLSHLSFLRDWKNPADFPTVEPDEATVRADLQYHPDAIKDYINETLIPSHDALTSAKHSHNNKTVLDGITADDVAKLAQEPLYGTTLTLTPTQVYDAVSVGIPVMVHYFDGTYGSISFTIFNAKSSNVIVSQRIISANGEYILAELTGNKPNGTWSFMTTTLQTSSITDTGGYFTTDTVEGALQEIGAKMTSYSNIRPTVMFGAQIDTSNNHVQMDDQDAYDRIRTAYENGSTVTIELYYDSSRSDILPLVTVGANYLSFAATTGYYFSPGHDDIAVLSNIMVTLHSDYTSHCYKNIIYEK